MFEKRIIACLDIMGGRVVKGINFVNMADVGDPAELAARYEEQGADEVVFLDITATNEERETVYPLIERAAKRLTIPLTVGGGVRTVEDFRRVFDCGAAKAAVNSAAVADPGLIRGASGEFGKRRVVAAIDGKKVNGGYRVFIKGGREDAGLDLTEWAKKCEALGAGEILLTSMDGDGTRAGYDIPMTKAVAGSVGIPVTASGGCGETGHIIEVFRQTGCAAALAASLFHYGKATPADVKAQMKKEGLPCRA